MMLASPLDGIGVLDAAIVAVLGYAVVFFGLILLMIVIMVMGNIFIAKDKKREALNAAAKATIASVPVVAPPRRFRCSRRHSSRFRRQAEALRCGAQDCRHAHGHRGR